MHLKSDAETEALQKPPPAHLGTQERNLIAQTRKLIAICERHILNKVRQPSTGQTLKLRLQKKENKGEEGGWIGSPRLNKFKSCLLVQGQHLLY